MEVGRPKKYEAFNKELWEEILASEITPEVIYKKYIVGGFGIQCDDGMKHIYLWTVNSWRNYVEVLLSKRKTVPVPNKWVDYQFDSMFKGW